MTSGARSRASLNASWAVGGLSDDSDVRLQIEEGGEGSTEHGLILGEKNANRSGGGHEEVGSRSGSSIRRRVPWFTLKKEMTAERFNPFPHASDAIPLLD